MLVSHDWHLVELVADRLWLVADGTVRPFDGDLDDYERLVLEGGGAANGTRSGQLEAGSRRAARRLAAERRRELEPLRQTARRAEETITRLTKECEALDRALARPAGARSNGLAPVRGAQAPRRAGTADRARRTGLAGRRGGDRATIEL